MIERGTGGDSLTEKQKVETVLDVFRDYIEENTLIEIFWSEQQKCYFCINWEMADLNGDVWMLETGEKACKRFLDEIFTDQYMKFGLHKMPGINKLNELQMKETRSVMEKYLEQLPEYISIIDSYM